ncbi:hypothetical protein BJX96DRAFT_81357 [Aspergillus floccosus]
MAYHYVNGDYGHNPYPEGNTPPYPQQYPQYPVANQATPRIYLPQQHHGYPAHPNLPLQQPHLSGATSYPSDYVYTQTDGRAVRYQDSPGPAAPAHHAPRGYRHREESNVQRQSRSRRDSHQGHEYRVEPEAQPRRHAGREHVPRQFQNARNPGSRQYEIEEEEPGVDSISAGLRDVHLNGERSVPPNMPLQTITARTSSTLDIRYQVKSDPKRFFKQGRVFSILWHENAGANADETNATFWPTQFGERVFSHIRRMVVVKEYNNCAWCFAIYTYKNRGLSKNAADASKHAVIYMEGSEPAADSSEPRMLSKALEVRPVSDNHKLSPMSRLNFGKLFTVEHNVKVLHIGKITERSMPDFLAYARREICI